MTKSKDRAGRIEIKSLLAEDEDDLRAMVQAVVEATLAAEVTAALMAEKKDFR